MGTHRWQAVLYVLCGGHFVRRDNKGGVVMDSRGGEGLGDLGPAFAAPFPRHTLVRRVSKKVIAVELKQP